MSKRGFIIGGSLIILVPSPRPRSAEAVFPIPISSTCTEDLTPVNRSILVAGRLPVTNLATLL